ncbi:mitochondrial genome maintenance exonuclease 1 [Gouania willdenowi]|uniref:Mitochondrial genome maintenance exonuclease 1 n=1 Tax=Gouania willdenowi TaxID=441366 RepID=A0A8C5I6Y0_GOUWI|nr:mitochondrial genome maintenance exonuclease 1 [Gouania willdenowi]
MKMVTMCPFKRVFSVGYIVVSQSTSPSVRYLSAGKCLRSSKKGSPYSSVDTDRYSSLVKSVMSFKTSSQTPESLLEEDEHIYGPAANAQAPSTAKIRLPKILHPLLKCDQTADEEEPELGSPLRILLTRGPGRSAVPSVTRILQQTLSPEQIFYLDRWKKRMIAELGEEGFRLYSQRLFSQGKRFHLAVEKTITADETKKDEGLSEYPADVQGYMRSISHILEDVSAVRAIESTVQHDTLDYLGVVDCVARYRGVLCVIDWKTSEKPKPFLSNTYDNPCQVAAYAGALNNDENYNYQVNCGLIVVAYKDGSPAHAHQLNSELMSDYWNSWLLRLEDYKEQRSSSSSEKQPKI